MKATVVKSVTIEEISITEITAIKKLIGATSSHSRQAMGLTEQENQAASLIYDYLDDLLEKMVQGFALLDTATDIDAGAEDEAV